MHHRRRQHHRGISCFASRQLNVNAYSSISKLRKKCYSPSSRLGDTVYVKLDICSVKKWKVLLGNSESTWLIGQSE